MNNNYPEKDYFNIRLLDILISFRKLYLKILLVTSIGAIITVLFSLSIPEKYVSQAISVKAEESQPTINQSTGNLLGILGSQTISRSVDKTITILNSRSFFRNFYENDKFLFELMAVLSFNIHNKKYNINERLYDLKENKWIQKPTFEESYEVFHDVFSVSSDMVTNEIYTITKHPNPMVALEWNKDILAKINQITKDKQIKKSQSAIDYYKIQLLKESSVSVRSVLMSSMATELQTIATSNSTDEYSLEVIDPPFLPERSSEPNNAVISILGSILSFVIACLFFITRDLYRLSNNKLNQ